jgi:hypothetical protein
MNKGLFLLIIVVFYNCNRKNTSVYEEEGGWYGKLKVEERRKLFPFNEATKVLLISFPDYENSGLRIEDSIVTPWGEKLPPIGLFHSKPSKITKPVLHTFKAFYKQYSAYEIIELNQQQLDSLSHLAFNYKLRKVPKYILRSTCDCNCYRPRNAVLFFNKYDELILNFEICFECSQFRFFPSNKPFNLPAIQSINSNLFKDFFKQCNVHYGVDSLKN